MDHSLEGARFRLALGRGAPRTVRVVRVVAHHAQFEVDARAAVAGALAVVDPRPCRVVFAGNEVHAVVAGPAGVERVNTPTTSVFLRGFATEAFQLIGFYVRANAS